MRGGRLPGAVCSRVSRVCCRVRAHDRASTPAQPSGGSPPPPPAPRHPPQWRSSSSFRGMDISSSTVQGLQAVPHAPLSSAVHMPSLRATPHAAGSGRPGGSCRAAWRALPAPAPVDVAADAEQLGAGVVLAPKARKPLGAAPQDGGRHRHGLHVGHRGGAAVQAHARRERRLQARLALRSRGARTRAQGGGRGGHQGMPGRGGGLDWKPPKKCTTGPRAPGHPKAQATQAPPTHTPGPRAPGRPPACPPEIRSGPSPRRRCRRRHHSAPAGRARRTSASPRLAPAPAPPRQASHPPAAAALPCGQLWAG